MPAWVVSFLVHVVILSLLGAATFSREVQTAVASINSALVSTEGKADELMVIDAPPSDAPRDRTVGDPNAIGRARASAAGSGPGPPRPRPGWASPAPSARRRACRRSRWSPTSRACRTCPPWPRSTWAAAASSPATSPTRPSDVGVALDQLAREILRHLAQHKLTVVWLFDESGSMKDDQRAIRQKFDRVASELKIHAEAGPGKNRKTSDALNHAIVGFGKGLHYELEKPTSDIDEIGRAIDHLRIDDTGVENTMEAIQEVIGHYASLIRKDRRLLLVLVTDESGDDGGKIEEAPPGGRQPGGADLRHRPAVALRLRAGPPALHRPGDQGRLLADRSAAAPRRPTSRCSSGTACTSAGTSSPRGSPPTSWPAWPRTPAASTSCSPARRTCGSATRRRRTRSRR